MLNNHAESYRFFDVFCFNLSVYLYMRAARPQETNARWHITELGRQILWQTSNVVFFSHAVLFKYQNCWIKFTIQDTNYSLKFVFFLCCKSLYLSFPQEMRNSTLLLELRRLIRNRLQVSRAWVLPHGSNSQGSYLLVFVLDYRFQSGLGNFIAFMSKTRLQACFNITLRDKLQYLQNCKRNHMCASVLWQTLLFS